MNFISTIQAGLLVSLKTTITGNVTYQRRDIETDHETEDGAHVATWETERHIRDADEHERALKARNLARTTITRVCSASNFGLLAPANRRDDLLAAVDEARRVADGFNALSRASKISVNVIVGRISEDDVEAVRAINSEVRSLLDEIQVGIYKLDPERIRDAANRARNLGQVLSPQASEKLTQAIATARSVARQLVKSSEQAATQIDATQLATLRFARTAFLDLDTANEIGAVASEARALDLQPVDATVTVAPAPAAKIEL